MKTPIMMLDIGWAEEIARVYKEHKHITHCNPSSCMCKAIGMVQRIREITKLVIQGNAVTREAGE